MLKQIQKLRTIIEATLWITDGESIEAKQAISIYSPKHGFKIRYCQKTAYPHGRGRMYIIDPNRSSDSFNSWNLYIKAEVFAYSAGEQRIDELTRILTH